MNSVHFSYLAHDYSDIHTISRAITLMKTWRDKGEEIEEGDR